VHLSQQAGGCNAINSIDSSSNTQCDLQGDCRSSLGAVTVGALGFQSRLDVSGSYEEGMGKEAKRAQKHR
jgi:hypothetical protein